jgi:hypothetical protein
MHWGAKYIPSPHSQFGEPQQTPLTQLFDTQLPFWVHTLPSGLPDATQFPLLQIWPPEHATSADQVRQPFDETQVCTPLPEHCFAPEVHWLAQVEVTHLPLPPWPLFWVVSHL